MAAAWLARLFGLPRAKPRDGRPMFLIVGLGNPGPEYELTPHNLGFLTIDRLASEHGIRVTRPEANSLVGEGAIGGQPVVLAKPLSYMNLSGGPVRKLLEKTGVDLARLLVIYDELALPWADLRIRERGSAGGHHGVESIIEALKTNEFMRLRLGIHPGHRVEDGGAYVLRRFRPREKEELDALLGRAADAVKLILAEGAAKAMTVYNRRAGGTTTEGQ
jgi:peptidyl-tRNA hydrolase, PTH1 family